ncbi:hypothetical protein NBRC116493_07290 [Aurantivibrio infirmus]
MGLPGSTSTTLIAKNTEVVGDIYFSGTLHIEGTLRGNVHIKDGKEAHLDIAENGIVEGQIIVSTVRINGKVIGDVHSSKHVELAAKAVVEGNVNYHLIEMVRGAQVNGKLVYGGDSKPEKISPVVSLQESSSEHHSEQQVSSSGH